MLPIVHIGSEVPLDMFLILGYSSKSPPALQLLCGFALLWYCFLSEKSHIAFAPPKITFLILWTANNGVQRNSLAKSGILSVEIEKLKMSKI